MHFLDSWIKSPLAPLLVVMQFTNGQSPHLKATIAVVVLFVNFTLSAKLNLSLLSQTKP